MARLSLLTSIRKRLSPKGVARWAWFTLGVFFVVVLEGAVVRATSSGGGCGNHWPLCNGEVFPHHPRLATIIEFTHRSLTGFSSACLLLAIAGVFSTTERRHPARLAASFSGFFLIAEALLGAVLVKFGLVETNASGLRVVMQSVHFTNTLLLLAATALTAYFLQPSLRRLPLRKKASAWCWIAIATVVLTGATGSLAALADTIFPSPDLRTALSADFAANSPLLIRMRWMHPAAATTATLATLLLCLALRRNKQPAWATMLAWNIAAQIAIGVADVVWLAPVTLQVLHLLSADVFWILLVLTAAPLLTPAEFSAPAVYAEEPARSDRAGSSLLQA